MSGGPSGGGPGSDGDGPATGGGPVRAAARVGVVVGVLLLGVGVGEATQVTAGRAPAADVVPVVAASAVCPRGPVTAGAAGTGAGELLAGTSGVPVLRRAGEVVRDLDATVVSAGGALAAGLVVEHVRQVGEATGPAPDDATAPAPDDATAPAPDHATGGVARGLLAVRCAPPSASAWFVGGGTTVGQTTELLLVNTDATPAVVDVRTWSATGAADPRPGRALRVPARGHLAVPLDRLAPDRDLLALHVAASRGRVAASLQHVRADGRTPLGVAQVPAVASPSRDVVLPGLPAGPGRRAVVVTNPGERDVAVTLQLTTSDGQLAPVELDVPAGTSVAHEVTQDLARTPAAARVTSADGPVLAGALVEAGTGAARDLAWVGAAEAVTADALLPRQDDVLLLTALDQDSVVELVPVGADGRGAPRRRVEVAAATTVAVDLTDGQAKARLPGGADELRPVRGRVHAARVLRQDAGPGIEVLAVVSPPRTVRRPAVVADPLLGR